VKKVFKSVNQNVFSHFAPVSTSLSNTVGCLSSSTDCHAVARTAEVISTNNKWWYKQAKDLHSGERSLSQTPTEEFDETKFTTESCSNSLVALFMQIKKQFALEQGFEA